MSEQARRWPSDLPFIEIKDSEGGPAIIDGFDCKFKPGDYLFRDWNTDKPTEDPTKAESMEFVCPRTGKKCGEILVGYPDKPPHHPSWHFNGDIEKPTLHPSVNCTGGCGWHGWLKEGKWVEC